MNNKKERLYEINVFSYKLFRSILLNEEWGKAGRWYVRKRMISDEMSRLFGIGYAPGRKFPILNAFRLGGFTEEEMVESGLFKRGEEKPEFQFHGRLMFPICDKEGNIIAFGGRVTGDLEPKYKNSPETELYHKRENLFNLDNAIATSKSDLILCEGYMDVLSMCQAGFMNTVASLGTALTEEQCILIKEYFSSVIILYDSDEPGRKAADRAIGILEKQGITVKVSDSLPYKDPDEALKKLGKKGFEDKLKNAMGATEYMIYRAKREDESPNFEAIAQILIDRFGEETPELIRKLEKEWK